MREVGVNKVTNLAGRYCTTGGLMVLDWRRGKLVKRGVELVMFSAQRREGVTEDGRAPNQEWPEIGVLAAVVVVEHGDDEGTHVDDGGGRCRARAQRIGKHRRDPALGIVDELCLEDGW